MQVKISDIIITNRKRTLKTEYVNQLAESIKEIGLLNPITLSSNNKLLSGLHRLEAVKSLGMEYIECHVLSGQNDMVSGSVLYEELIEIDENLARSDLSVLERAEQFARRKEIYEEIHPETKQGQYGHKGKEIIEKAENELNSFSEDTSEKTGISQRVIQQEVKLSKELCQKAKLLIIGTPLEDKKAYLIEIAKFEDYKQVCLVDMLIANPEWSIDTAKKHILLIDYGFALNEEHKIVLQKSTMHQWNHGLPIEKQKEIAKGVYEGKYPPFEMSDLRLVDDKQDAMISEMFQEKAFKSHSNKQKQTIDKKPFVVNYSGYNEWYTPSEYIESARVVMDSIDTDPASSELANTVVKANTFYTIEDNGLDKEWHGNVFMNPPYSKDLIPAFVNKLIAEYGNEHIKEAIVLVNNATETKWFLSLVKIASAVCFIDGRVKYWCAEGQQGSPLQGQALIYIGDDSIGFGHEFAKHGWVAYFIDKLFPDALSANILDRIVNPDVRK